MLLLVIPGDEALWTCVSKGAYWENRYFATTMDTDEYLARRLIYIDMNMVRAGVVIHPGKWKHSAYHKIQTPPLHCPFCYQKEPFKLK